MNTNAKATAPTAAAANAPVKAPTVAPTPAFDLKTASAQALVAHLTGLQEKAADHTIPDAEMAKVEKDIAATYGAIRNLKKSRTTELDGIKDKLSLFSFTVQELFGDNAIEMFSDTEILAHAKEKGLFSAKAGKAPKAPKGESTPKVPKASDSNPVFLIAPKLATDHHKTIDTVHRQGRANDNPFTISTPLLRAAGKDADETIKNLMKLVQPESADYAKSEAGKAELAKIAKYILKHKAA